MPAKHSSTPQNTISGIIYDANEMPLCNVKVQAFDKDIRSEQKLGETTTDNNGAYSIGYSRDSFATAEHKTADVFIKVISDRKLQGQSPVYFNVPAQFVLNFKLGNQPVRGLNELDALLQLIRPLIEPEKLDIANLQEDEKYKDISFLAGETGEDAEKIAFLPIAFTLAKQTDIAGDIFYGLFRMQMPTTLDELANVKSESLLDALQKAIDQNIISPKWQSELQKVVEKLNSHSTTVVLNGNSEQQQNFKTLISAALPQDTLQQTFVNTWFRNESTPDTFWSNLSQQPGFDGNVIERTQNLLQLNHITNQVPALSTQLFNEQQQNPALKDPRALAAFTTTDWENRISPLVASGQLTTFPNGIEGNTPQEKTTAYAAALAGTVKSIFPLETFDHRMTNDSSLPFGDTKDLQTFFSKNTNYDLASNSINADLDKASFENVQNKFQLVTELKNINRLYKLADDYSYVGAMRKANITNASDIVLRYGRSQFGQQVLNGAATAAQATAIYDNALSVHRQSLAIAAKYKTMHDLPVYVINGVPDEAAKEKIKADLASLFHDATLCDCAECTSVHSPAAYLVDILQFLRTSNSAAFDELLRRRPDLQDILLTCTNTNTPLPYIDIVNELLESIVVNQTTVAYQTTATAAELAAYPQNLLQPAYDLLNASNAGYALPLDLPLETARILFDKLGIKRQIVLETLLPLGNAGIYDNVEIAKEVLQLSTAELAVLNGTSVIPGITGGVDIKTVLQETGLSYIDLLQVLESYVVNETGEAGRELVIVSTDEGDPATCDIDSLVLQHNNADHIRTLIRFVRLQKKTGWSVFDLDKALLALNVFNFDFPTPDDFNQKVLLPLANIIRLQNRLGLPITEILALFANIDAGKYIDHTKNDQPPVPSLYEQLFRNKFLLNPIDEAYVEDPFNLTGPITGHTATLLAAFNNSLDDLKLLMAGNGGVLALVADELSHQNLSELLRRSRLAAGLKLSVKDFFEAVQLTGIHPFAGGLRNTLLFIDSIRFIRTSGVTLSDLNYLLRNVISNSSQAPSVTFIASVLDPLRNGLKQLSTQTGNTDLTNSDEAKALVTDKLSSVLKTDPAIIKILAGGTVRAGAVSFIEALLDPGFFTSTTPLFTLDPAKNPVPDFPDLFNAYIHLSKLIFLVNKYKLTDEEVAFLVQHAAALGIDGLLNNTVPVPFTTFENLATLIQWRNALPVQSPDWHQVLTIALANEAGAKSNYFNALATISKTELASLTTLLGNAADINDKGVLNAAFPADYIKGSTLLQVMASNNMAVQAGSTMADMVNAAQTSNNKILNGLLKARSTEAEWLQVIKPVSNRLRHRRRDALVAYLLADPAFGDFRTQQGISDINSLYEYLLIDTEMDACMYTSRIKQAISAVQLFIDRCLMNLEAAVALNENFATQWNSWRKQYRVWEANRKIFLYPENWVQPELRDDKTPFFADLEAKLLQSEVTADSAKNALREYLEKLDAVSNLQVAGLFVDEATGILHVFGKTRNTPYQYYYRNRQQSIWSPWEKVDLDIEGEHILPVVWNNRLHLFWPQFTEKQVPDSDGLTIGPSQDTTVRPAPTFLEIKLVWSEYKNGKWIAKKVSKEAFTNEDTLLGTMNPNPVQVSLSSLFQSDQLQINLHVPIRTDFENDFFTRMGAFVFDGCNQSPKAIKIDQIGDLFNWMQKIPGSATENMQLSEFSKDTFALYFNGPYRNVFNSSNTDVLTLFGNTPGTFKVQAAQHELNREKPVNFFYNNGRNNFYVQSAGSFNRIILANTGVLTNGLFIDRRLASPVTINGFFNNGSNLAIASAAAPRATAVTSLPAITFGNIIRFPIPPIFIGRRFSFTTFYHPYVCSLIKTLNAKGIDGLYDPAVQNRPIPETPIFTGTQYAPTFNVRTPYPVEKMDFDLAGSYSIYNWELFFQIPLLIATRLSQNQQFDEARKWFHYIFNPTVPATDGNDSAARFWVTNPFKKEAQAGVLSIEELLTNPAHAAELQAQLDYWEQHPFNPHAVARHRIAAYMRTTVMKYIDNLIAWGDQLFTRDTIESINEATLLYILASNILGKKPEKIPARAVPVESSFADIADKLDSFSNAAVEVQLFISPSGPVDPASDNAVLMPLFCIPKNTVLLGYWDTVADRLFKIRHCMNIQGVVRQLPLFEPPIDPGLLVRAAALGLDLTSIMNDINPALSVYRFPVMLQKADELCNEVKVLGGALLSILERKDAEQLTLLRAGHELSLMKLVRAVKQSQVKEAQNTLESLQALREMIDDKRNYYATRPFKNGSEESYFSKTKKATQIQEIVAVGQLLASLSYLLPEIKIGSGFTIGATYGGANIGKKLAAGAEVLQSTAQLFTLEASMSNILGTYERRRDDWNFQAKNAVIELKQAEKQIAAAEVRLAIAETELSNHDEQIEQTTEENDFMLSRFTNNELYDYMVGQLAAVYFQSYQLAYNMAKKAEKCFQHELGLADTAFIQFGYWDSLKKGLLSGERLQYDLRRLENAYLEQNIRELEITKHISAALLSPAALLQLKETGACDLHIPEGLFDLDFPGHYFRRIKSVSLSIPCIAGPYTSVNATLRLTANEYRIDKSATTGDAYHKTPEEENTPGSGRFRSVSGLTGAIATSSAQMDSGLFELNFRDERYLPFEGAGAVSTWRLELMEDAAFRQFDYSTISDIILHVKYTARDGGAPFKNAALENLQQAIAEAADNGIPFTLLFDIPREYTNAWYKFTAATAPNTVQQLDLAVSKNRLPFFTYNKNVQVKEVQLFARKKDTENRTAIPFNETLQMQYDDSYKLFKAVIDNLSVDITKENDFVFSVKMNSDEIQQLDEFFMLIEYKLS